jgi:hypothetical protein
VRNGAGLRAVTDELLRAGKAGAFAAEFIRECLVLESEVFDLLLELNAADEVGISKRACGHLRHVHGHGVGGIIKGILHLFTHEKLGDEALLAGKGAEDGAVHAAFGAVVHDFHLFIPGGFAFHLFGVQIALADDAAIPLLHHGGREVTRRHEVMHGFEEGLDVHSHAKQLGAADDDADLAVIGGDVWGTGKRLLEVKVPIWADGCHLGRRAAKICHNGQTHPDGAGIVRGLEVPVQAAACPCELGPNAATGLLGKGLQLFVNDAIRLVEIDHGLDTFVIDG